MHKSKVSLPVINETTCYEATSAAGVSCQRKSCKQWISYEKGKNCVFITSQEGSLTLREVGKIYNLTRMRICQIEKNIYQKIRSLVT